MKTPIATVLLFTAIACGEGAGNEGERGVVGERDAEPTESDAAPDSPNALSDGSTDAAVDAGADARDGGPTPDASPDAAAPPTTWVTIPGGRFVMGNNAGATNETPEHAVTVPAFQIMTHEVTVAEYRACVVAHACAAPAKADIFCGAGEINSTFPNRDAHPVNCVKWQDAADYCAFAGVRLPSEAEWEFAARGPTPSRLYAWGDVAPSCALAVMDMGGMGCGDGHTAPVCSRPAGNTPDGLCDMTGNVWEWVADKVYTGDGYRGAPADGSAWIQNATSTWRSTRGSGWQEMSVFSRATVRSGWAATHASPGLGFRCARAP